MRKEIKIGSNLLKLNGTTMSGEPVVWATTNADVFLLTKEQAEETYEFLKHFLSK